MTAVTAANDDRNLGDMIRSYPGMTIAIVSGIHFSSGALGSVFYMMTCFHAIHIVGGLGSLLYIVHKTIGKSIQDREKQRARLIALFWHFLVIVWAVISLFGIVY